MAKNGNVTASNEQTCTMVHVHVGDKVVTVACGAATQRVKWLAHVGVARTDDVTFQVPTIAPMMTHACQCYTLYYIIFSAPPPTNMQICIFANPPSVAHT